MAHKDADQDHDPSRREFFKTFSRQTIQNAGAVAGAAAEIRRTSMAAARELLDMNEAPVNDSPTVHAVQPSADAASAPKELFRSPYRFTGSSVVVLDQRDLPGKVSTFECRTANDVAAALRAGAVTTGPVMGQVAAYGVVLAAQQESEQHFRAAVDAIKSSRAEVAAIRQAAERMIGRHDEFASSQASDISDELSREADAITTEATAAFADIARRWAELVVGDQTTLLVHGNSGPLACGMVGMLTAGVRQIVERGSKVHVWVTEASPSHEGSRLTALELTQHDIPHTVIPDSGLGWLFASRSISAVVLRGDTIASNGETIGLLGASQVAELAHDFGVPGYVLAPSISWDRRSSDVSALVLDLRSAAEMGTANRARLEPPFDVVPARNVTSYITEDGALSPPFKEPR